MRLKRANLPAAISTTNIAAVAHIDITTGKFSCMVCGMNFDNVGFDKVQQHYRQNHIKSVK
jgi:membrane carboxypeptidase/penicillin-binding protein